MFPVFPFSRLRVEHILNIGERQTSALLKNNKSLRLTRMLFLIGRARNVIKGTVKEIQKQVNCLKCG